MPKIHKKTGSLCVICDEPIIQVEGKNNSIIFHKTRRQTHSLCIDCGISYLQPILKTASNNIRANIRHNVDMIKCPGSYHGLIRNKCKCVIKLNDIYIPDECDLSLDIFRIIFVLSNNNVYLCPDEKCGAVIDVDLHYFGNNLKCHNGCETTWCRHCLVSPFHDGKSCIEVEAENNNSENGKFIWDMKTKGFLKFCPQCRSPCIKNNGCNKMVCSRCNIVWCWLCTKANISYDHYNINLEGSCTGKLWEGVDINGNAIIDEPIVQIN